MIHSIILFISFLGAFFLIYGIFLIATAQKRYIEERFARYTTEKEEKVINLDQAKRPFSLKGVFQNSSRVFTRLSLTKRAEGELAQAALPLKGEEFILINLLSATVPSILLFLLTGNPGLGVVTGLMGLIAPWMVLGRAKKKRIQQFNNQIGDALTVMSNSLRAGFSFLQAMEMVSKEMPAPISEEFGRALIEMNLGTGTEEALLKMTNRIESDDLDLMVTAVIIQRQVGGNLSEVLDNISHTIRERIRIKGEIKTLTAQGRMSGMVIGFLPAAICSFLFVMNPGYMMPLFTNPVGVGILIAGVVSQLIGVMFIRKIIAIEV